MGERRSSTGARMLPGHYYTDREVFARETERIFLERWLYVGHVSELAETGRYLLARQEHESLIVVRGRQGDLHALHNVCRHRGSRICQEAAGMFPGAIQCPYHAWTYELDGQLRQAPSMEDVEGFRTADYPLGKAAVGIVGGFVFVSFSEQPEPFDEAFAPIAETLDRRKTEDLRSVHQSVYDVAANWKLLFQNYSECYHCPTVHPVLNRLTPYRDSSNDLDEGAILGGPMKLAGDAASMTMSGRACAAPLAGLTAADHRLVYYYTLLPNMFLSLHPDYVLVHRAEALAADRTRIHCDWYFHQEAIAESEFDPAGAIEFWDMTNRQDWHLCTISQQGISSRAYSPGPYSELESQLAAFDREYLRLMAE